MKAVRIRALLFVAGLLMIGWSMAPRQSIGVGAAPALLITETTTGEPATPTPITPTPAENVDPTSTPTPTASPVPVATVTPVPEPRDREPTATPLPTLTPLLATPIPGPDPAVSKSVSPGSAGIGETVVYTILVTNLGGLPATGVVVDDTLPVFLELVDATATRGVVTTSGRTVRVEIGDLAAGETVEVRVSARVLAPATPPDNVNLAVVTSSSADTNTENNRASVPLDTLTPEVLPNTGATDAFPLLIALLGLALVAASLVVRPQVEDPQM